MYTHARNAAATRLPYSSLRLHRHDAALYAAYDVSVGPAASADATEVVSESERPRPLLLALFDTFVFSSVSSSVPSSVVVLLSPSCVEEGNIQVKLIQVHSSGSIYLYYTYFYIPIGLPHILWSFVEFCGTQGFFLKQKLPRFLTDDIFPDYIIKYKYI